MWRCGWGRGWGGCSYFRRSSFGCRNVSLFLWGQLGSRLGGGRVQLQQRRSNLDSGTCLRVEGCDNTSRWGTNINGYFVGFKDDDDVVYVDVVSDGWCEKSVSRVVGTRQNTRTRDIILSFWYIVLSCPCTLSDIVANIAVDLRLPNPNPSPNPNPNSNPNSNPNPNPNPNPSPNPNPNPDPPCVSCLILSCLVSALFSLTLRPRHL